MSGFKPMPLALPPARKDLAITVYRMLPRCCRDIKGCGIPHKAFADALDLIRAVENYQDKLPSYANLDYASDETRKRHYGVDKFGLCAASKISSECDYAYKYLAEAAVFVMEEVAVRKNRAARMSRFQRELKRKYQANYNSQGAGRVFSGGAL